MTAPLGFLIAAALAIAGGILFALYRWQSRVAPSDKAVLRQMEPIMEELWNPLRHLADLKAVWPHLSEAQRREIEESFAYRERHHEVLVERHVQQLLQLARRIRSLRLWRLRHDIIAYLKNCPNAQPDQLKILLAVVRKQRERLPDR